MTNWKDMAARWRSFADRMRAVKMSGPHRAELYALINRHDAIARQGETRVDRMEAASLARALAQSQAMGDFTAKVLNNRLELAEDGMAQLLEKVEADESSLDKARATIAQLRTWIKVEAEQRGDADAGYPPERRCAAILAATKSRP